MMQQRTPQVSQSSFVASAVLVHHKKKKRLHGQRLSSIIFSNETPGRELSALEKNWLILFFRKSLQHYNHKDQH
jgi:hypothetical protein